MKYTLLLDTLINNNEIDIGQSGMRKHAEEHKHVRKLAGIWLELAINQKQTYSDGPHNHERDKKW